MEEPEVESTEGQPKGIEDKTKPQLDTEEQTGTRSFFASITHSLKRKKGKLYFKYKPTNFFATTLVGNIIKFTFGLIFIADLVNAVIATFSKKIDEDFDNEVWYFHMMELIPTMVATALILVPYLLQKADCCPQHISKLEKMEIPEAIMNQINDTSINQEYNYKLLYLLVTKTHTEKIIDILYYAPEVYLRAFYAALLAVIKAKYDKLSFADKVLENAQQIATFVDVAATFLGFSLSRAYEKWYGEEKYPKKIFDESIKYNAENSSKRGEEEQDLIVNHS